jgi:hypothetical protein
MSIGKLTMPYSSSSANRWLNIGSASDEFCGLLISVEKELDVFIN